MNFSVTTTNLIISITFFFLIFSPPQSLIAQQPAFPSAYGDGAYTSGGRGGAVIHVTNLNDSGSGSFRDALSMTLPRTIVFDVSGVINLKSLLYIDATNSNVTIAGQTAPEGGITIAGNRFYLKNVSNIIVRHIRFKGGVDAATNPNVGDNLGNDSLSAVSSILNQIFDHCTFAFGADESASWYVTQDGDEVSKVTIQKCLFAENVKGSIIGKQSGKTGPPPTISFISNLFYNSGYRFPNVSGDNGSMDIINNVIWNSKGRLIRGNGSFNLNQIGNYYHFNNFVLKNTSVNVFGFGTIPKIYSADNKIIAPNATKDTDQLTNTVSEMNSDNKLSWKFFQDGGGYLYGDQLPSNYFVNKQHLLLGRAVKIMTADESLIEISNSVGCNARLNEDGSVSDNKDVMDSSWLSKVVAGTFTNKLSTNEYIVPPITSIKRTSTFYVNNPHIPEIWFAANVPAGQNHNDIAPSGYTWLEEYLNQVDGPSVILTAKSVEVTPDKTELQISKTLQLSKTFTPTNATNQNGTWTSSDEDIAKVDANGVVTAISVGEVTIMFTATDGGHKGQSEITVFTEALQASAGIDQNICQGASTTLTATGGTTYLWSTGETTASIKVTPDATTTYSVTAYDSTGKNSDTDDVTVTVNPLPTVDAGNNVTINSGESTTLTATGATSYEWSTGATTASITVTPKATNTYTVTGTTNGCEATDTVNVTVSNSETVVADAGGERNLCAGSSTTLTATGGATYLWSTGEKTAKITVSPSVTTIYTVTAYDSTGKNSDNADVKINVKPLPTVDAGKNITINSGESTTLTATGATTYEWSTGATSASITVSPTATKTYTVTGIKNGCEATDKVTVTVKNTAKVVAKAGPDQNICNGSSTTLTATGGDTYLWSTGAKTKSITVNPTSTAKYSVTAFVGDVSGTDEVVVYVDAKPNVIIKNGSEATILEGEFITLSANGANSYKWSNGATKPNIAVSPRVTEAFEVTGYVNDCAAQKSITVNVFEKVKANAGDDVTICRNDNTVLTASGPDNTEYLWSTGETTKSITVDPKEDTEYSVMVYHALDSDTDNVIVKVENCKTPEQIIEESTELTDDSTELEFLIHPNPTHGEVNIKISGLTNLSSIHLYDLSGKSLYTETINEGDQQRYEKSLDLSDYASGIYLLQLVDNERVITKKVILR